MLAIRYATWAISAAAMIFLAAQPVSLQTQFVLGLGIIAIMLVMKPFRPNTAWRHVYLALGTVVVLRYVYWRTANTLPPVEDLWNFIPGMVLYTAEMYCVLMLGLSLFTIAEPIDRPPPPDVPDDELPTVDVFVPTYNEDLALVATTLGAALGLDYPADKLRVFLLDDGGTDQRCNSPNPELSFRARARRKEFSALAEGMGVTYLARAENSHAKAGNLNNGLAHSTGDLVVVFDADHAPARDFLRRTVGYFVANPKLFLVQTPHFFLNPDPLERNLTLFGRMPSENEMFYGIIQRGLDKWNAAFFCGSAAVMRRAALLQVGGFSGQSITEDCETALELHAKGWESLYLATPLIAGLQPETFASFIGQRSRWAMGMTQILRLKNPMLKRGLSFPQRLCYASNTLHWFFALARPVFVLSPLLYLFFSLEIYIASAEEFVAYTGTYLVVGMLLNNFLFARFRWPWVSELYEYIQSVYLYRAVINTLLHPHRPSFNVTAKGQTLEEDHLSEMATPFFVIFGLILLGAGVAAWRYVNDPINGGIVLVVAGWNFFNLILTGTALGVVSETRDLRRTPRILVQRRAEVHIAGEHIDVPVRVHDASIGGVNLKFMAGNPPAGLRAGALCTLAVEARGTVPVREVPILIRSVRSSPEGVCIGAEFYDLKPVHYRAIADMLFADSALWFESLRQRRTPVGIASGTTSFTMRGVRQMMRGLSFFIHRRSAPGKGADKIQGALPAGAGR